MASNAYGGIYVADGATGQSVSPTPAKMTGFATEGNTSDDQGNLLVEPDVSNDKITVDGGHAYLVSFNLSATCSGTEDIAAVLRVGGTEVTAGQCRASMGTADASMGFSNVPIEPASNSDVEIYLETGAAVRTLTPVHAQLSILAVS